MVSHMTHRSHVKSISFNATMFHEFVVEKKKEEEKKTAFIDQRAAPLVT